MDMPQTVIDAYKRLQDARKEYYSPTVKSHNETMLWNSPEHKEYEAAQTNYVKVVRESAVDDYFLEYEMCTSQY